MFLNITQLVARKMLKMAPRQVLKSCNFIVVVSKVNNLINNNNTKSKICKAHTHTPEEYALSA